MGRSRTSGVGVGGWWCLDPEDDGRVVGGSMWRRWMGAVDDGDGWVCARKWGWVRKGLTGEIRADGSPGGFLEFQSEVGPIRGSGLGSYKADQTYRCGAGGVSCMWFGEL